MSKWFHWVAFIGLVLTAFQAVFYAIISIPYVAIDAAEIGYIAGMTLRATVFSVIAYYYSKAYLVDETK